MVGVIVQQTVRTLCALLKLLLKQKMIVSVEDRREKKKLFVVGVGRQEGAERTALWHLLSHPVTLCSGRGAVWGIC